MKLKKFLAFVERVRDGRLPPESLTDLKLMKLDCSRLDLSKLTFRRCCFDEVLFYDADLTKCRFLECTAHRAVFSGACLKRCICTGSAFTEEEVIDLMRETPGSGNPNDSDARKAFVQQRGIQPFRAERAEFMGSCLDEADFSGAVLQGCNFKGAHLECFKAQKANFQNANLHDCFMEYVDFREADLRCAFVEPTSLFRANLLGVQGLDLSRCDFTTVPTKYTQSDEGTRWPKDFDPLANPIQ